MATDALAGTARPAWLKVRVRNSQGLGFVESVLRRCSVETVCEQADCPNRLECHGKGIATFLILGRTCTRSCGFCAVGKGPARPPDPDEPGNVARAARELGLKHVVITSVTRDDLPDGGARHFAETIRAVRLQNEGVTIEVLTPDFRADRRALREVVGARPEIVNHNVETVPRLYPRIRPQADYTRSLLVLATVKAEGPGLLTKSGIMAGFGETRDEVLEVLRDLRGAGCDYVTIGQYLSPSALHYPVAEYVTPDVFDEYRRAAEGLGFKGVASAPLVRSSYNAREMHEGRLARSVSSEVLK